ncbi:MAG: helix-turn-helix transcriptional regulator [Lachnospiraceae bacterium]|nr:helix-turn-helix transcriptional regulator [Lachnospiraceae bacterium]
MDYLTYNVSVNLKKIRHAKGMSLEQTAEQTGVSKSMLAQIERGTANPSIGVLGKIASGLRIQFQELIQHPKSEYELVDMKKLSPTKELEGVYRVLTCFPFEDSQYYEIYRIDVEPGGQYFSGAHGEKTREYVIVTEGELTVECHGNVQTVCRDQIYKFETYQDHVYRNTGTKPASCICVFIDYARAH